MIVNFSLSWPYKEKYTSPLMVEAGTLHGEDDKGLPK